jgi:fatty acid amide hydrolase
MLCRVFGRTDNPWKLSRTPGGSSGGEGAMVASLSSPLGLGM